MPVLPTPLASFRSTGVRVRVSADEFPPFLPKEVDKIRDPPARALAKRIERLPIKVIDLAVPLDWMENPIDLGSASQVLQPLDAYQVEDISIGDAARVYVVTGPLRFIQYFGLSKSGIMSSCVKPLKQKGTVPLVLLHGFDSSCLEWGYTYPLLEDAGLDTWAVDILGWGFSDLETCPSCNVAAKREHLYQFWKSCIGRPMVLVGPSLGAAVAIDFAANHPEVVAKLILIDASVFAEGTGILSKLPRALAYAGVSLLKSIPLRLYANTLAFNKVSFHAAFDWTKVGRLHCLLPWWEDATVDFMISGGYNVVDQIKQIKQSTLIIWGEDDKIVSIGQAQKLHDEMLDSILHQIPNCGHLPHVEKPESVLVSILEFLGGDCNGELNPCASSGSMLSRVG